VLDEHELADAFVGLAQLEAGLFGEPDDLLARPVGELGVGREGDVLRLHRGVDDDAVEITRLHRAGAGRDRKAFLQQRLQALFAHAIAPAGDRGALKRQRVLEEDFTAEVLIIRVLDPAIAHDFVAEIESVLENGEACHQPGRQRWLSRPVAVDGSKTPFEETPVDLSRQPRQRMAHVDDRFQRRPEKVGLPIVARFRHLDPSSPNRRGNRIKKRPKSGIPNRKKRDRETELSCPGKPQSINEPTGSSRTTNGPRQSPLKWWNERSTLCCEPV